MVHWNLSLLWIIWKIPRIPKTVSHEKKSPYHCISEKIQNKTQNRFLLGMRKELAVNIIFLEVNQNLYFSQSDIKYVDLLVCAKWLFNV